MFVLADIKWGTPTLGTGGGNVQWDADLSSGLQFDQNLYDQSDFDDALRDAFQVWEDEANINFVESLNDAEISVSMAPLGGTIVGLAELTFFALNGTDLFSEVEITLDSTETWAPYGETDLSFFGVAAHEIGHALGLLHVDDETQIMHDILEVNALGEGDIDGAVEIYGEKPEPVLQVNDDSSLNFFERFFNLILSLFGISTGNTQTVQKPAPWTDEDLPSLEDVINITDILDPGAPGELVTIIHEIPHPDFAHEFVHSHDHGPGCSCLGCAFEAEMSTAV